VSENNGANTKEAAARESPASIGRKTAVFVFAGAVAGACNVALTLFLLQLMGGEGYRVVGLSLSASVAASALAFEWLRIFSLRFSNAPEKFAAVYWLYAGASLALFAGGGVLALAAPTSALVLAAPLIALISIVQAIGDFLIVMGRGRGNLGLVVLVQAGRGVLSVLVCAAIAETVGDPFAVLGGFIASHAAISLIAVAAHRATLPASGAFRAEHARDVMRFGAPLMASALVNALLAMSDRWIAASPVSGLSEASAGGYIAAADLFGRALTFVAGVLVAALVQDIAAAHDEGRAKLARERHALLVTGFTALAAPVVVAAALFGSDLAAILFSDPGARPDALTFAAVAGAVAAHTARNALVETILLIQKRTGLVLGLNILALVLAWGLSFPLAARLGVVGVPIAFILAAFVATLVSLLVIGPGLRGALVAPAPIGAAVLAILCGWGAILGSEFLSLAPSGRLAAFAGSYVAAGLVCVSLLWRRPIRTFGANE
jgi:O-antigen/teichoic acid export membrane protein